MKEPISLTLGDIRKATSDLSDDTPIFVRIERVMVRPEVGYVVNDIGWEFDENNGLPTKICLTHIPDESNDNQ